MTRVRSACRQLLYDFCVVCIVLAFLNFCHLYMKAHTAFHIFLLIRCMFIHLMAINPAVNTLVKFIKDFFKNIGRSLRWLHTIYKNRDISSIVGVSNIKKGVSAG